MTVVLLVGFFGGIIAWLITEVAASAFWSHKDEAHHGRLADLAAERGFGVPKHLKHRRRW